MFIFSSGKLWEDLLKISTLGNLPLPEEDMVVVVNVEKLALRMCHCVSNGRSGNIMLFLT